MMEKRSIALTSIGLIVADVLIMSIAAYFYSINTVSFIGTLLFCACVNIVVWQLQRSQAKSFYATLTVIFGIATSVFTSVIATDAVNQAVAKQSALTELAVTQAEQASKDNSALMAECEKDQYYGGACADTDKIQRDNINQLFQAASDVKISMNELSPSLFFNLLPSDEAILIYVYARSLFMALGIAALGIAYARASNPLPDGNKPTKISTAVGKKPETKPEKSGNVFSFKKKSGNKKRTPNAELTEKIRGAYKQSITKTGKSKATFNEIKEEMKNMYGHVTHNDNISYVKKSIEKGEA